MQNHLLFVCLHTEAFGMLSPGAGVQHFNLGYFCLTHGLCVSKADKFQMYVNYCKNKPDSTQLILEHAGNYFDVSDALWLKNKSLSEISQASPPTERKRPLTILCFLIFLSQEIQQRHRLANSISSYLIKPVQRITKYQLLLKVKFALNLFKYIVQIKCVKLKACGLDTSLLTILSGPQHTILIVKSCKVKIIKLEFFSKL